MKPATKRQAQEADANATRKGLVLGVTTEGGVTYFALTKDNGPLLWAGEKPPTTAEIDDAAKAC